MRKIFLIMAGLALLLVVAIAGSILFRVPLLQKFGPSIAGEFGIEVVAFQLQEISHQQLVIPRLEARYTDGELDATVSVKNLLVQFHDWSALRLSVKKAVMDELLIEVSTQTSVTGPASQDFSATQVLSSIAAALIDCKQLDIKVRSDDQDEWKFRGRVARDSDTLTLEGEAYVSELPVLPLSFELNSKGDFDLAITPDESETGILQISGELEIEDNWLLLDATGDVGLAAISRYINTLVDDLPVGIDKDLTRLELAMEMDLDAGVSEIIHSMAARMEVDTSLQISVRESELRQAMVDSRFTCVLAGLQVLDCSIRQPVHTSLQWMAAPAWVDEYFSWQERNFILEINPASEIQLRLQLQEPSATLTGDLQAYVRAQNAPFTTQIEMSGIEVVKNKQHLQVNSEFKFKTEGRKLVLPVSAARFVAEGRGTLTSDNINTDVRINRGAKLIVQQLMHQDVRAGKIEFIQQKDATLHYRNQSGNIDSKDIHIQVLPVRSQRQQTIINTGKTSVHMKSMSRDRGQWAMQAHIELDRAAMRHRHLAANVKGIGMNLYLDAEKLNGSGRLTLEKQWAPLQYSYEHALKNGQSKLAVMMESFQPASSNLVEQLIAMTGYPLQLEAGKIDLKLMSTWDKNIGEYPEVAVNLAADEISGNYAQNRFTNLSTEVQFSGSNQQWRMEKPVRFELDEINVGVPVTDVSFGFDRMEKAADQKPVVRLDEFSARALDGSIFAEEIEIDLNQPVNQFSVYLFNLSLEKLLALNQTKDLIASGYFNGELPIQIEDGRFSVQKGWIRADQKGGIIKYDRIDEVLSGNPNLELVAGLLKDFRYNEMSAQIDLQPNGELLLKTKLYGRSPKAELNKQVNLNFNIEFNLWKFLESARLLTRIDQDVSEQILSRQKGE